MRELSEEWAKADAAVLSRIAIARWVAKHYIKARRLDPEDAFQAAMTGMIERARLIGADHPDFTNEMFDACKRAIYVVYRDSGPARRWEHNYRTKAFLDSRREPQPMVEVARSSTPPPDEIVSDEEWWRLATFPLSAAERQFVSLRFRESLSIEDAAAAMDLTAFDGRRFERESLLKCAGILRTMKDAETGELYIDVPSFRERKGDFKNARGIVEIDTGKGWASQADFCREIGCRASEISHALRRRDGELDGRRFRYATSDEQEDLRADAEQKLVRIDPRSKGLIDLTSSIYYRSLNHAAKELGLKTPGLWKAVNKGGGVFAGRRFRYATDEENESYQQPRAKSA